MYIVLYEINMFSLKYMYISQKPKERSFWVQAPTVKLYCCMVEM